MKSSKPRWQLFLYCAVFSATNAYAAIDIAQLPLETGTTVDPNIMLMVDDSGSMMQALIPEGSDRINWPYARGEDEDDCATVRYANINRNVCLFSTTSTSVGLAYLASSQVNKMYYDPAVTYKVPKGPDGTSLGNASFTSAWLDGYDIDNRNQSQNKLDLSSKYMAFMSLSTVSTGAKYISYAIGPNSTPGAAFYYQYRAGCANGVYANSCYDIVYPSSAAEKVNFANWFSYYRTRIQAAKGGIGESFHEQSSAMRVGYSTINKLNLRKGVRKFNGTDRTAFFTWLYKIAPSGGTPLRPALVNAGEYYKSDEPWRTDTTNESASLLECRQSYTILMTDGYYSTGGINDVGGEHDNVAGTTILGPRGRNYKYQVSPPFAFATGNTLADIAMNYWKNDLRVDLENTVPTSTENPAFWQHMVTFGVAFGVQGTVNPTTALTAMLNNGSVTWGGTGSNAGKIDDLLHAGVNSRGGFFSAGDPVKFAEALSTTLSSIAERVGTGSTAAATAVNSLQTESTVYQARFVSGEWSGDLWSYGINDLNTPTWKASEKLPNYNARKIYYGSTSAAKEFQWSNMTSSEKTALGGEESIVSYLRGDSTLEKRNINGKYRNRSKILGDMVNSSPELVAEPLDYNYQRYNWSGATSYRNFLEGPAKTRSKMIYVGGNDGMLHAFDATTGVEKFAYIPKNVMTPAVGDTVNVLNKYADPRYVHRFSVDGTPVPVDVYIGGQWKTLLVGGLGRGSDGHSGGGFYALDITNPNAFDASKVLWDKSYAEAVTFLGKPLITRANSGHWVMIVGYGYNNNTHKSGILVVDLENGNIIKQLPTSVGTAAAPNATSELSMLDINADGLADWVYGGDLFGNVWKFDLSSTSTSGWKVDYGNTPLFVAKDASGNPQMITGGVLSVIEPKTGKVWLFFGTGRFINQDDPGNAATQTWYGIQDGTQIAGRVELEPRLITTNGSYRNITATSEVIDREKKGWYMDLPGARERIVDTPMMVGNELVMNTLMPDSNACNPGGTGFLMAISPFNGTRLIPPFFDLDGDGFGPPGDPDPDDYIDGVPPTGIITTPKPPRVSKDPDPVIITNCPGGPCVEVTDINPTINAGMQSWREISK